MKDACDWDKWREVVKSMTIQNPPTLSTEKKRIKTELMNSVTFFTDNNETTSLNYVITAVLL